MGSMESRRGRASRAWVRAVVGAGCVLAVAVAGGGAGGRADAGAAGTALAPGLEGVETFAFAIGGRGIAGDSTRRLRRYGLIVADGEDSPAERVAELRERGKVVLAYLSVGTIEDWRSWFDEAKPYRLGREPDWEGEWYARLADPGYRELIAGRVAPELLAKGFDGLFLDNTDMIETHRAQTDGMHALVSRLGALVHAEPGYLFAQNGDGTVGPMLDDLDGWNREDVTATYDFDRGRYRPTPRRERRAALRALTEIRAEGLLTTTADYTRRDPSRLARRAVENACAVGALPFVSDIGLTRVPERPRSC